MSVSFPKALFVLAASLCFSGVSLLAQVDVPGNLAVGAPLNFPGGSLKGEYWKRPPNTILTDGRANRADGIDRQIAGFGAPSGTFSATRFVYLGNDLTPVTTWLGVDAPSYFGVSSNLDDGAFRFSGYINIASPRIVNMGLTSDDGSRITIGGLDIAERDGSHGDETQDVDVNFLAAGLYPIEVTFFNGDWTSDGNNHTGNPDPGVHGGANFHLRMSGADITPAGAALLHPTAPRVPALVWTVGLDDNGWPVGDGGGANTSFVQENGSINPLPGSPVSTEVPRGADNDYYFAGSYTTVIAGNGAYAPVGTVAVNEEAAERAFAAADNDLRYHFNLPSSLTPLDLFSVTFDALNLDDTAAAATRRYGIEVYFNGVKVQDQIVIHPAEVGVSFTTPLFSLASVNAQTGPGADNIVSLRGINYNAEGGGNWMGVDYVQLNGAEGLAPGYLLKQRFENIGGSVNVADLLSNPKYINNTPDFTCLRTDFSANDADECDSCGYSIRGYFIPKASGPHTFYISADDGAALFLSTNEDPANKRLIAVEPAWTGRRNYIGGDGNGTGSGRTTTPSPSGGPQANISGPITLIAGNSYYIEGALKEGGGGDNLDVAVQGPGDPAVQDGDRPISGDRIAAKADLTGSSLAITQNPALARIPEGGEVTFTVAAAATSPLCGGVTLYQWQRKGSSDANYADIAGANSATYSFGPVRVEDNLSSYRCLVRIPGITRISTSANLEVLGRECLRVVSAAGSGDFTHVKVVFSTFIDATDVATTDPFSYVVTGPGGPLTVTVVAVNGDGKSVTLTTDPQVADADYVVAVTGVRNIVGSLTCDPPNNQATFRLSFAPGFALKEYFQTWTAGGGSVDALITGPQPAPTISCFVNLWQMNTRDEYDNYGGRISGYFVPVTSGPHVFYFASDDFGRLFLSTDSNPANKVLIAFEPQWNGRRQWLVPDRRGNTSPSGGPQDNISGAINLVAGQKYYMESWFTEGGGGDNMAVAVQGPGQPVPANDSSPVTTANFGAYITPPVGASATITLQPIDATALQSSFATFTAAGNASSPLCGPASTYQWYRNGVPIIGATSPTLTYGPVALADNGARFKMRVAAVGVSADSAEAVLTINQDVAPPLAVAAVAGPAPNNVTIKYNELLEQSSAAEIFNYEVLGAVPSVGVVGAVLQANGSNVVLTLDGNLTVGRSYSVRINFVADLAGNVIVPTTLSFNVPTTGGYAAAVQADGPIAYYRFNDAPPTAANLGSLGAAANGTYNGGAATGSEALRPPAFPGLEAGNTALQCNGTDAFVGTTVGLFNTTYIPSGAFTVSGWLRRNGDQPNRTGLWGQNDIMEIGYINNNTLEVWTDNGLHQSPDPTVNPFPNGEWAHLAIVSDGSPGVIKMYTNGVFANQRNHTLPANQTFNFNIGGGGVFDGTGNFFNGQIDEVAVYDKALSAAQIQRQYRAAFTTPGFGFDDGQLPPGTTASGTTPPYVQDGVLHLTDRVGGQQNFWTVPLGGAKTFANIKATWRTLIDNPGGADGLSFTLGTDVGTGFTPEEGGANGLSVCIDTYNNGTADAGLDIKYNGTTLTHLAIGPGGNGSGSPPELALSRFVNTSVEVTSSGAVTFQYDTLVITAQLPNYSYIGANQYVFAARTGGANENCWIDDVIFSGEELEGPATVTITLQPVDQTFVVNSSNPAGGTLLDQTFTSGDGGFTASGAPAAFTGAFAYDAAAGSWQVNASDAEISTPYTSRLQTPTLTIGASGHVRLTMEHRWSVEAIGGPNDHWDGTQLRMSVNGGAFVAVPASAFTQGGYNGAVRAGSASVLTGQAAWIETSEGHDTGAFITSVAELGLLNAGDTVRLEFLYGGDTNTRGNLLPSWEITSVKLSAGIPPDSVTFTTAAIATVPGNPNPPLSYQWSRDGSPIPGATGASYTLVPVIGDNGAKFRCVASTTGASATTREATLTVLQNVPASTASAQPLSYPGGSLKGEYWQRPVNSIFTDGSGNPAHRIDTQIAGFGPASGTFRATGFVYLGNDLTAVPAWLAGDAASFAGTPGNLDDGAFRFKGYINITAPGIIKIGTTSDDGSRVKIGGLDIVDNDNGHGDATVDKDVSFDTAGLYPIEITYFNGDWTSDGNNHTGNPDPAAHGGANFHLRIGGADVTSATAAILHPGVEIIPPVITCPANVTTRADAAGAAVVTYPAPTVSDNSGSATVVCVPPSGTSLLVGDHTVTCTATDPSCNTATCSFRVTVLPFNLPPTAVISSEQLINLKPEYDNPVLLSCNWWNACLVADGYSSTTTPPGGALTYLWFADQDPVPFAAGPVVTNCLEVGTHTIVLVVTDSNNQSDSDSKTIEVVTAPLAIDLLIEQVETANKSGIVLTRKITRELTATLRVALSQAGRDQLRPAQQALDAFEKKVRAQVVPIAPDAAAAWIRWSQAVSAGMEKCIKPPRKHDDGDNKDDDRDNKK